MAIESINPATGEKLKAYDEMPRATVDDIVVKAHEAFVAWRRTSFRERADLMRQAAQILRGHAGDYARLMALEMGKPLRDGIAEAQKCALGLRVLRRARRALPGARAGRRPTRERASSPSIRWASCSRSCRGTFRSGRCSASRRRH